MTYIPPKKFTTDKLPATGEDGDMAFHDTLKTPLYWNNGWHQTTDGAFVGPIDLFLIAGQSNAHGHADVSGLDDDQLTTNDVLFHTSWHHGTSNASDTQYYIDWSTDVVAGETTGTADTVPIDNTKFGPEVGFARRAKELSSTKAKIGILKYAVGASQLTADQDNTTNNFSDWDLTATGDREGDALRGWKSAVTDGLSKLTAAGLSYNIKGLIWWQGESGGTVDNYKALFTHMRDYLDKPNLPIIVTVINYVDSIRDKYFQLATDDDYIEYVDSGEFGHMEHGGNPNHVGAIGEGGSPKDMFNIGMEYANVFATMFGESPIAKIDQTITFPEQPTKDLISGTHIIQDVHASSGLDVTYTSSDTSIATIADGVVTMLSIGTITITATQAGDNSYNPVSATQTLVIADSLWNPEFDNGVASWWDASDTNSLTIESGTGTVTEWRNKTAGGPDFVQWIGDADQSTETVDGSDLDTIHLNNDALKTTILTNTQAEILGFTVDPTKQKDLIWYFVARVDPSVEQTTMPNNNEALIWFGGSTSSAPTGTLRQHILLNTSNSSTNNLFWYDHLASNTPSTILYHTKNATYPAATSPDWLMIGTRFNYSGDNMSTWQVGGPVVVDSALSNDPVDTNVNIYLNKYQKTLEGEWGEIVVSSSTDQATRQRTEGYLAHKWGLIARLPSDHPYKSNAPGTGLWTPSETTTTLWLDADDAASITHSSNAVSQWSDKSGNGTNMVQSTASKKPTLTNNGSNSLPTLTFDGVDDSLLSTQSVGASQAFTVYSVVRNISQSTRRDYLFDGTANDTTRCLISLNQAGKVMIYAGEIPGSPGTDWGNSNISTPSGFFIVAAIFDGSTSQIGVNGTHISNIDIHTNSLGSMRMGTNYGAVNDFFEGDIGEFIIVDGVDPQSNIERIEGYLAHKWDLVSNLPSDHKFKYSAPTGPTGDDLHWTPDTVQDISVWFDAADLDGDGHVDYSSPGAISSWNDKSGNDRHASSAVGTPQLSTTDGPNNGRVVKFLKNQDYMPVDGSFFVKDMFFVFRSPTATWDGYGGPLGRNPEAGNNLRGSNYITQHLDTIFHSNQYPDEVHKNGVALSGNFDLVTIDDYMIVRVVVNDNDTTDNAYHMIARVTGLSCSLDIAEIVAFGSKVSDADADSVEGYLAHKWGLEGELPSTHTYKAVPPEL